MFPSQLAADIVFSPRRQRRGLTKSLSLSWQGPNIQSEAGSWEEEEEEEKKEEEEQGVRGEGKDDEGGDSCSSMERSPTPYSTPVVSLITFPFLLYIQIS